MYLYCSDNGVEATESATSETAKHQNVTETYEYETSTPAHEDVHVDYIETRAAKAIELYGGGFLLFFGAFGNIMSLVVLCRKKMRSMTMSLYLSGVAVCDLGYIIMGQVGRHWVRNLTGIDPNALADWYCKLWMCLIAVFGLVATYLLAGVSAERCFAVIAPLKSIGVISKKSVLYYYIVSIIIAVCYSIHPFFSLHVIEIKGQPACTIDADNYFATHLRVWTDFFIAFACPGAVITICSMVIIYKVIKAKIKREAYLAKGVNDKNQTYSTIVMLVTVCVAYIVLLAPLRISYFIGKVFPSGGPPVGRAAARARLFWAINVLGVYLNHSITFYLYVISGREFRGELRLLLGEMCGKICGREPIRPVESTLTTKTGLGSSQSSRSKSTTF